MVQWTPTSAPIRGDFVLFRAHAAQMLMAANWIVEGVGIVRDVGCGQRAGRVDALAAPRKRSDLTQTMP